MNLPNNIISKSIILVITLLWVSFANASEEKPCIRFLTNNYFRGELESAKRLVIACENLGWSGSICYIDDMDHDTQEYDWNMTLVPGKSALVDQYDFLVLFDPTNHFFDQTTGHLYDQYMSYTAYLPIFKNIDLLIEDVDNDLDKIYDKPWYPTAHYVPYKQVNPDRLFYIVATWGNRKADPKFRYIQSQLSKKKYTDFYGSSRAGASYGKAFKGEIPFDGHSILERIAESGVCLVFHSDKHLNAQIPSGRIFEAAAASAVIICDLNPFVIENFGDSVLYVDQKLSAVALFKQIDNHMKWIKNNKAKALEMAKRSHQIFEEKFLLENQLLNFKAYFDRIRG